jgi:hypothetical protein
MPGHVLRPGHALPGSYPGHLVPATLTHMEASMEPIRTDFTGYEGQYVALDWRTGEIVLADQDPQVVLREAKDRNHVVVQGRVPYPDEPTRIY